jgi:hypothetical protein
MYNRAVCVHKFVYESLMRMAWTEFLKWIEENNAGDIQCIQDTLHLISELADDLWQKGLKTTIENSTFQELQILWNAFHFFDKIGYTNGDLSSFWMSYVDFVEDIILGLLRASRECI